jgi:hypothetical protein
MESMVIWATFLSIIPLLLAFMMPNWYLGDSQNAVEDVDLAGEAIDEVDEESDNEEV